MLDEILTAEERAVVARTRDFAERELDDEHWDGWILRFRCETGL